MEINTNIANRGNYGNQRKLSDIKYIVIHYTANDGDTAENNGKYFHNNIVKASAHYFVDSDSITQSVPDDYVAYSVGGNKYPSCESTGGGKFYGICKNTNSISIELCDDYRNGTIYPTEKTILNALELTKSLMKKYNVPIANVIRHFDVMGKLCPAYWVDNAKWKKEFLDRLSGTKAVEIEPVPKRKEFTPYLVKVTADFLNVRKDAGVSYPVKMVIKQGEVYTIVEEKNGWGKLKSGAGWINLSYTVKK